MHSGLEDRFLIILNLQLILVNVQRGVGLIITGGISPNRQGWLLPAGGTMNSLVDIPHHRLVTHAVHKHGAKILCKSCILVVMDIIHFQFLHPQFKHHLKRVKCQITNFGYD
jgi:hypothetical protein